MTLSASTDDLYKRYYGDQQPVSATAPAAERSFLQDLAVKATQSALSFPEALSSRARAFAPEAPGITEQVLPYVEKSVGAEGKAPATGPLGVTASGLAMLADPTLYVGGTKGIGTALASTLVGETVKELGGGALAQIGASAAVPVLQTALSLLASKRGLNKAAQDALRAGANADEILSLMTVPEKAELRLLMATDPEQRLAKAIEQETTTGLLLERLPSQFVQAPGSSLESLGNALQQTPATKTAGQVVSSAGQRISKSMAQAGQQLVAKLKKSLGLAGVNGFKAITVDTMAARARNALQNARDAAYKPLSDAYKAWDRQYGKMKVAVSGDTLRDLISQTREMYTVMGGNVRGALERGTHSAMGTSLSRLEEGLATIGVDNLVDIGVNDLRNVQKAIRQKTALTMPGDASRMLFYIDDQIENLLVRGLSGDPSAMKKLQQINSQYSQFKQTFDRNASLRPLLNPRSKEVASFKGILNEDGIQAYQNALGQDASHGLGYFMLQDALEGSPQRVLSELEGNRAVQLALGDKYSDVVSELQKAGQRVDAKDLVLAHQELSKALDTPGLPASARASIVAEQQAIESQLSGTSAEKQLRQLQEATAARKFSEAAVEKVAAGSPTEKLRAAVSEARTPAQMRSVLNQARKQGPEAANAVADLFLERLMTTASREPIEFVQQIAQNRDIWLPLMGSSNQSAFQRLAKNFDKLERELAAATKTRAFQEFIKKAPEGAKGGTLARAVDLLTKASGMRWLARAALRGTPISRTIDSLLSGTPESKARTLIELLRESGPNSLLQALRADARSGLDTTEIGADAGEPLNPELQAIYDRIYGNVSSR